MISLTSPVETAAHHWPAGAKLAALCVLTMILFQVQSLAVLGLALVALLLCYAAPGRQFLRTGLSRLLVLWPFVLIILIWHGVTGQFRAGFLVILPMIVAVGAANLVTMTTRLSDMIETVEWLLTPLRKCGLRTDRLSLSIALVIRFTPVLAQKGAALIAAWRARSAKPASWQIVLPFAVLAIDDAERVADAIKARSGE